jgi:hypothetical protein
MLENPKSQKKIVVTVLAIAVVTIIVNLAGIFLNSKAASARGAQPPGFQLLDEKNLLRAEMRMDRGVPMFVMYDEHGDNRILATESLFRVRDPQSGIIELEFSHGRPLIIIEKGNTHQEIELDKLADLVNK